MQVVFSLGMMCFCVGMIASDKDKMLPIFLPLLTAQVGIWTPGPKMKKKKPDAAALDPELGNMKDQVAAVTAHAAQQSNVINQLVQRAATAAVVPPSLQMTNQQ